MRGSAVSDEKNSVDWRAETAVGSAARRRQLTRMGGLMKALAVLGLLAVLGVSSADAAFMGTLTSGPWTVELGGASANTDVATATVLGVRRNKLVALGTLSAGPQATDQLSSSIPTRISRVIIAVDLPANALVQVRVMQGSTQVVVGGTADHQEYVFNVGP